MYSMLRSLMHGNKSQASWLVRVTPVHGYHPAKPNRQDPSSGYRMHHGHTLEMADGSESRCFQSDMCCCLHVNICTSGLEMRRDAKQKGLPWVPVLGVLCFAWFSWYMK